MQKRTKIFILIIIGLLLLAFGIWVFLTPYLEQRAAQPPGLGGTPYIAPGATTTVPTVTSTTSRPAVLPVDPMHQLQNRAKNVVERMGSGSSETGFLGYGDVLLDMTASGRVSAQAEQAALQKAHPMQGALYTMTTRAVSSMVVQGKIGDTAIVIDVETIQTIDDGGKKASLAKRAQVRFQEQGEEAYIVESIAWSDVAL